MADSVNKILRKWRGERRKGKKEQEEETEKTKRIIHAANSSPSRVTVYNAELASKQIIITNQERGARCPASPGERKITFAMNFYGVLIRAPS